MTPEDIMARLQAEEIRFLVAVDPEGEPNKYHVRRTIHVTHDITKGEAIYVAEPIASGRTLSAAIRKAAPILRRKHREENGR